MERLNQRIRMSLLSVISLLLMLVLTSLQTAYADNGFDVKVERQSFEALKQEASSAMPTRKLLRRVVDEIDFISDKAKFCADDFAADIKKLDLLLKESKLGVEGDAQHPDYAYLQNKRIASAKKASECRLLVYHADEALETYRGQLHSLSAQKALTQSSSVLEVASWSSLKTFFYLDWPLLTIKSGIAEWQRGEVIIFFLLLFVVGGISWFARQLFRKIRLYHFTAHTVKTVLLHNVQRFIMPLLLSITILFSMFVFPHPNALLTDVALLIFLFTSILFLLNLSYGLATYKKTHIRLSFHQKSVLFQRGRHLISLLAITLLFLMVNQVILFPDNLATLGRMCFLSALTVILMHVAYVLLNRDEHGQMTAKIKHGIRYIICLALAVLLAFELAGYHQLVTYFGTALVFTTLLAALLWLSTNVLSWLFDAIENNQFRVVQVLKYFLVLKQERDIPEFTLLQFSAYAILWIVFIHQLLVIWGAPDGFVDRMEESIFFGFKVAGLKIVPVNFLSGVLVFTFVNLLGRFIATTITRRSQFEGESDTQVAIASILKYVFFTIAVMFALLVMGFDLTSLTIIAGALSVGIGLGLQGIVNNFVSGLVLLLEKPIKPGDRVLIGETEGIVKRIRIRSTQITTTAREDVIIPNSDLVTTQVINYMFRNRHWRVTTQVGVAYGSDVDLVKKTLLEIAKKHPDVLQNPPNQPMALFQLFGDSSLRFELWVIIRDVNKKFTVKSDLNFAIDAAFKEQGIQIAFPQLDLHIKSGADKGEKPDSTSE